MHREREREREGEHRERRGAINCESCERERASRYNFTNGLKR